jgi:hypothetical protein
MIVVSRLAGSAFAPDPPLRFQISEVRFQIQVIEVEIQIDSNLKST